MGEPMGRIDEEDLALFRSHGMTSYQISGIRR